MAARAPASSDAIIDPTVRLTVNERPVTLVGGLDRTLLAALGDELGLTGTKEGCAIGVCGACSVLVDGRLVSSCLALVGLLDGAQVVTVEGLGEPERPSTIQQAFVDAGGLQCGICTPGQVVASHALLAENARPTDDEARAWLAGNLCRCTGYAGILAAVRLAAERRADVAVQAERSTAPGPRPEAIRPMATDTPAVTLTRPDRQPDGLAKATGRARYLADHRVPGMLVARTLRSDRAHAIVRRIDVSAARRIPGVRAIVTGADARPIRVGRRLQDWPVLAWDRVRFAGDRVAAVAADDDRAAQAAIDAISVEYDDLPAVLDPQAALGASAPVLHPDAAEYRYLGPARPPVSHPNVQGEVLVTKGLASDPAAFEALFTGAAHAMQDVFVTGRQHQCALEPHGALVDAGGSTVRVLTTNKGPFALRGQMAAALGLPADSIVVETGAIGGDFGSKGLSIDEYACYLLSRAAGRPVRLLASYDDELSSYAPRHGALLTLRSAVDRDGRIVAHDADLVFDGGAYAAAKPIPELIPPGALDVMAPYDVPNVRIRARAVYTNSVPGGHMRCPGELQAAFASESHVDRVARETGHDPVAFRLRNAVRDGATSVLGQRIRRPMAAAVLERLAAMRIEPGGANRGIGVALVGRRMEGGQNTMIAATTSAGHVRLVTGLPDQGATAHTAIARIAATVLGIGPAAIDVEHVTTAEAPPDIGIGASRVTYLAGHAAARAAERLRDALVAIASERLPPPVRLVDGQFRSDAGDALCFDEVALVAAERGVRVEGTFDTASELAEDEADFTFAGLAATVSVDRPTGRVHVEDALFVADTGTVINPIAHRGQIEGGFAQGLGAALMEELVFDGGQVQTANLSEYRIPAAPDVPALRIELLDEAAGPGVFGAKMAGELSPSCVAPALANAIADAVGVRARRIPITPERLLRSLREPTT